MLSKILTEAFQKTGKGNLRVITDKLSDKLCKYSLSTEFESEGNGARNWKYNLASINSEVQIIHNEEYAQIDQEESTIKAARLLVYFRYPENTNKKDIKQIRNIFLEYRMKKIKK